MKAQLSSRCKKAIAVSLVVFATALVAMQAQAHRHKLMAWAYYPVAYCAQNVTNQPLPPYVCCKLVYKVAYKKDGVWHHHWRHVWRDKWVANSCKTVDSRASGSFGCGVDSMIYGSTKPIVASCQFANVRVSK